MPIAKRYPCTAHTADITAGDNDYELDKNQLKHYRKQ